MKVVLDEHCFDSYYQWDRFLEQLFISENLRDDIEEIQLDVIDFEALDSERKILVR